jgi:hypothetical protein
MPTRKPIYFFVMSNFGRIRKRTQEKDFVMVPNALLRRKDLSFRAKGLLSLIISFPDDWVLYQSKLTDYTNEGKDAIRTSWNELLACGYIRSIKVKDERGHFIGYDHEVSEKPDFLEAPKAVFPISALPTSEKPPLLIHINTEEERNTNKNLNAADKIETSNVPQVGGGETRILEIIGKMKALAPNNSEADFQKEAAKFCEKYNDPRKIVSLNAAVARWVRTSPLNDKPSGGDEAFNPSHFSPLPFMMKLWNEKHPDYAPKTAVDYPALTKIIQDITGKLPQMHDAASLSTHFGRFMDAVALHTFYANKPLKTVANNIQEIIPIMKNPAAHQPTDPTRVKIVLPPTNSPGWQPGNERIKIRLS